MNTGKVESVFFIFSVFNRTNYSMEGVKFPLKQKIIELHDLKTIALMLIVTKKLIYWFMIFCISTKVGISNEFLELSTTGNIKAESRER